MRAGWAPTLDDAAALALAWARPGDVVLTLGVGEPWRIARAIVEGLAAMSVEEGVALARLTTIGTGGPARAYRAAAHAAASSRRRCAGRADDGLQVRTVGLGSNVLAADAGVDALVVRLAGELAEATVRGNVLLARAAARRTPSACIGRATPGSAGSSSPARSRAPPAAACG